MLVPPPLPVTFALAMIDDVVSSRNSDSNRKSQPGILSLTTDPPDGPRELSDLWTRQKPKPSVHPRKCICKSKAFISQMEAGVSTVCEEREREREVSCKGVAGREPKHRNTCTNRKHVKCFSPLPSPHTSPWRADRSLITQQAGSKLWGQRELTRPYLELLY